MSSRHAWEYRVNGLRQSGDTFRGWEAATARIFQDLNRLHHASPEDRDYNGRKESELIAVHAQMRRERPLGDVSVKAMRHGKPWVL